MSNPKIIFSSFANYVIDSIKLFCQLTVLFREWGSVSPVALVMLLAEFKAAELVIRCDQMCVEFACCSLGTPASCRSPKTRSKG